MAIRVGQLQLRAALREPQVDVLVRLAVEAGRHTPVLVRCIEFRIVNIIAAALVAAAADADLCPPQVLLHGRIATCHTEAAELEPGLAPIAPGHRHHIDGAVIRVAAVQGRTGACDVFDAFHRLQADERRVPGQCLVVNAIGCPHTINEQQVPAVVVTRKRRAQIVVIAVIACEQAG